MGERERKQIEYRDIHNFDIHNLIAHNHSLFVQENPSHC